MKHVNLDHHETPIHECAGCDGLRLVMDERDKRYTERDADSKLAVIAALKATEKAGDKTAESLSDYKTSANEWRATLNDVIAKCLARADYERDHTSMVERIERLTSANELKIADIINYRNQYESQVQRSIQELRAELMKEIQNLRESRSEGAGSVTGKLSQQQLIMWVVTLAVLALTLWGGISYTKGATAQPDIPSASSSF